MEFVAFTLDGRQFALPLAAVDRITRMVDVTPLPGAPHAVAGVIQFEGRTIPVFDPRRRFGLPSRQPGLNDHLIVARTAARSVSLPVDAVLGLQRRSAAEIEPADALAPCTYISGVTRIDGGILLIHDLERFLSPDEEADLERCLALQG